MKLVISNVKHTARCLIIPSTNHFKEALPSHNPVAGDSNKKLQKALINKAVFSVPQQVLQPVLNARLAKLT